MHVKQVSTCDPLSRAAVDMTLSQLYASSAFVETSSATLVDKHDYIGLLVFMSNNNYASYINSVCKHEDSLLS